MTCSDVERGLPEFLDGAPDGAFRSAVEIHVRSCAACADLVSDLELIASEAREMAATDEPAPRVWVRIAAQLRAEGLIREAEPGPSRLPSKASSGWRWSAWWLAPIAASLLAAGSYVVSHRPAPQVAQQKAQESAPLAATAQTSVSAPVARVEVPAPQAKKPVEAAAKVAAPEPPALEAEAGSDDQQFLSVVSTRAPGQRAAYEKQLEAVNANIREVQSYLARNPGDIDARQQLMDAYQQKALLYQIAMDRIQ